MIPMYIAWYHIVVNEDIARVVAMAAALSG